MRVRNRIKWEYRQMVHRMSFKMTHQPGTLVVDQVTREATQFQEFTRGGL